tara:strand:- start:66 stop:374 length:309 start_codon:yes stop_codon:yes gene_type:complete
MSDIKQLQDLERQLESALDSVRYTTKQIKYNDVPSDIIYEIENLADELDITYHSYQINDVWSALTNLESAIYSLEEIFEDALSDVRYKIEELEEEEEYKNES